MIARTVPPPPIMPRPRRRRALVVVVEDDHLEVRTLWDSELRHLEALLVREPRIVCEVA